MQLYSLKAVRTNLGLTLDEAAKLIGISKYTLFNYELIEEIRKLFSPPWPIMVYIVSPII